eukprot:c28513_g1_i1 orf=280-1767(-)
MWIQTLPDATQASILMFLSAENSLFRSKDLELLASSLLASPDLDFWVARGAENLLRTVSGVWNPLQETEWLKKRKAEMMNYSSVPDCLQKHREHRSPLLPWFPQMYDRIHTDYNCKQMQLASSSKVATAPDIQVSSSGPSEAFGNGNATTAEFGLENDQEESRKGSQISTSISLPSIDSRTQGGSVDVLSNDEQKRHGPQNMNIAADTLVTQKSKVILDEEERSRSVLGLDFYERAKALRESLLEELPSFGTVEDMNIFQTAPDITPLLNVIKPWEMDDGTTLFLIENLLKKQEGYLWSTKIISYVLLPKLISLEQLASRILVTAIFQASEVHPRAVVDALLLPLILCKPVPNSAQCEVINRVVKECLSPDHTLSLCQKAFLQNKRQKLHFAIPPPCDEDYLLRTLAWSEPVLTLVQNLFSKIISLDEETLGEVLDALQEIACEFAVSLKFSNLLLTLITKHGQSLVHYKFLLKRVVEKTNTFMTRSALAKLGTL